MMRIEIIICPNCGKLVRGEITTFDWFPFDGYYGYCENCGYIILESEWEKAPQNIP